MEAPPKPRDASSEGLSTRTKQKGKTRERNDAKWESLKDEIYRVYMLEDSTLAVTMLLIEQLHQFKASPRKWKEKMKEWNFDKNLTKNEMKVVIAKAEKRAVEEGKETLFFHRGNVVPPAKFSAWQKRIIASSPANPYARTPATIAYFTPQYRIDPGTSPHLLDNNSFEDQPTALLHTYQPIAPKLASDIDGDETVTSTSSDRISGVISFGADPDSDLVPVLDPVEVSFAPFFTFSTSVRSKLQAASDIYPYIDPAHHAAAVQYYHLEIHHDFIPCRFYHMFINKLFDPSHVQEGFASLRYHLSVALRSNDGHKAVPLVELLGQTLAQNKDYVRMFMIARTMSTCVGHRWSGISPAHFVGWWLHIGGLHKETIPHLEDAILEDLNNPEDFFRWSNYLPMDAPEMLLHSYLQLGPTKDWHEICNRLLQPGHRPFMHRIWDKILGSINTLPHFTLQYVQDRLHNLIVCLFPPIETARFYIVVGNRLLSISSFRSLASCLRLAIQCLEPKDSVWHCRLCAAGFSNLVAHIPECIEADVVRGLHIKTAFMVVIEDVCRYRSGNAWDPKANAPPFCPNRRFKGEGGIVEDILGYKSASKAFLEYFTSRKPQRPHLEPNPILLQ